MATHTHKYDSVLVCAVVLTLMWMTQDSAGLSADSTVKRYWIQGVSTKIWVSWSGAAGPGVSGAQGLDCPQSCCPILNLCHKGNFLSKGSVFHI